MSRSKRRADRIREEVPISDVLLSYGYAIHPGGGDREQQFPCDLHGDGFDSKPSARVYPLTKQWYCWACATSRDAIQTVREKENLEFLDAVNLLEKRYNLPPLPWSEEDQEESPASETEGESPIVSAEDAYRRVATLLKAATVEKSLSLDRVLELWEEADRLAVQIRQPPDDLLERFVSLRERTIRLLRSA